MLIKYISSKMSINQSHSNLHSNALNREDDCNRCQST